jgi:hypothetical protein
MWVTYVFIIHGLCAITLLGAVSHQAAAVWWPVRKAVPDPGFVTRFRSVKAANYTNAIIVLFLVTFILGSLVYPTYRINARIYLENLKMSSAVGAFEMKEHILSFAIGLLPAYWYYWRKATGPENDTPRRWLVLILAGFIWAAFLIGHVLNNIRGI